MRNLPALLLVLLVLAGGCVSHSDTEVTPYPPVERPTVYDPRVIVHPELSGVIRIVGLKSSASPEGFMKIQVNVQSLVSSSREFNYRITWFDSTGVELPMAASTLMSWTLLPHETSFLAATSPTPAARNFRIDFLAPGSK